MNPNTAMIGHPRPATGLKGAGFARLGRHARIAALLAVASFAAGALEAGEIRKCEIDGIVVFQDTPCPNEPRIAAPPVPRMADGAALERKLDRLALLGKGMVQRPRTERVEAPPDREQEDILWRPHRSREARAAEISERHRARTERKNAESAAALTHALEKAQDACGGKLAEAPAIGMTDEFFRTCTRQALFGNLLQVVVSEDQGMPLRLYVFRSDQVARVYSIDGVITRISP